MNPNQMKGALQLSLLESYPPEAKIGRAEGQSLTVAPHLSFTRNQDLAGFIACHLARRSQQDDTPIEDSFGLDVRAGKNTNTYDAHTYHTKVPPQGVRSFIEHYSRPGELVLDPFCGSGMTGLAAISCRRKAILSDLSPAAAFIAYNFCQSVDTTEYVAAVKKMLAYVQDESEWLYQTRCRICGGPARMLYTVWSYRYRCPKCAEPFVYADQALDAEGRIIAAIRCPHCHKEFDKRKAERTERVPVRVGYRCLAGCRRGNKILDDPVAEEDTLFVASIEAGNLPEGLRYPTTPLFVGYNTRQPIAAGLTSVDRFYTKRNLWILARLWEYATSYPDEKVRAKLAFTLTSLYKRVTLLSEYRFWGGSGNTANLYVPSLINEQNVCEVVRRKSREIVRFLNETRGNAAFQEFRVSTQSATDLSNIPDSSVDYVFTDPPFGSNINYSEMNLLWEAWLNAFTDRADEAIVNRVQGKSETDYERLMTAALREIKRVLRSGRWLTLVFHNSSERVWQSLQAAISEAGFAIGSVYVFDKSQETVKQAVADNAVGYDIVINCQNANTHSPRLTAGSDMIAEVRTFIVSRLSSLPPNELAERDERKLFSRTLGQFLSKYQTITLGYHQFRQVLASCCENRAGYWYIPGQESAAVDRESLVQPSDFAVPHSAVNGRRGEYLTAASCILTDIGVPLHSKEIYRLALEQGLFRASTHSPETLLATLSNDTKHSGTRFVRVSRGRYALKSQG